MKAVWRCMLVLLMLSSPVGALPNPCGTNAAYVPSDPAQGAGAFYTNFHNQQMLIATRGRIPVLGIGDSHIKYWSWNGYGNAIWTPHWKTRLQNGASGLFPNTTFPTCNPPYCQAEQLGYAGDTTQGLLRRIGGGVDIDSAFLSPLVTSLGLTSLTTGAAFDPTKWNPFPESELDIPPGTGQPMALFISIGSNNGPSSTYAGCDPAEVVKAIRLIVAIAQKKLPSTRIIVMGIFPHYALYGTPSVYATFTRAVNAGVRASGCSDGQCVVALDVEADFVDYDNPPNGGTVIKASMFNGGLHLTPAGYAKWNEYLDILIPETWLSTWTPAH